jgi:hypothetical protein
MIRVLVMIAVAGFVLCVACFTAAFALGGPDAITRGGWVFASGDHDGWNWDDDDWDRDWASNSGPQTTRTLQWSGADRLDLDLAADVRYIQAAGPATVTVTGPERAVSHVVVRGDSLRYDRRSHRYGHGQLTVVVRAPNISSFDISGRNRLEIEGYDQARLRLDVSGDADVRATGQTEVVELDLSGSGDVDVGALKSKGAEVDISGAAEAVIAPMDWAKLDISGAGDVRLLTHPPRLETDVSGAGKVHMGEPSPSPSPSTSPSASPSPSPKPGAKV